MESQSGRGLGEFGGSLGFGGIGGGEGRAEREFRRIGGVGVVLAGGGAGRGKGRILRGRKSVLIIMLIWLSLFLKIRFPLFPEMRTGFPLSSALFWGLGGMQIFCQSGLFSVFFML